MTTLTNSFEGGTSGTNVTAANSGGLSGNAFDVVTINTGATCQYDSTHAAHQNLSCKYATGASNVTVFTRWSSSMGSAVAQTWWRIYLYMTGNPGTQAGILLFSTSGGATCGTIRINTNGTVNFNNGAGSSILTTTNPINLNGWTRLEGYVIGNASTGQAEIKLFLSPDSGTPTETKTSAANINTNGAMGLWSYGLIIAQTNFGPFWMDDLGLSNTGYIGPATVPAVELAPQPIPPGFLSPASVFFTRRLPVPAPTRLAAPVTGAVAASGTFRGVPVPAPLITHHGELPAPVVMPLSFASPSPQIPFTGQAAASGMAAAAVTRRDPVTGRVAVSGVMAGVKTVGSSFTGPAAGSGLATGVNPEAGGLAAPVAAAGSVAGSKVSESAFTGAAAAAMTVFGNPPVTGSFTGVAAASGMIVATLPAPLFRLGSPFSAWATGVPETSSS